MGVTSALALVPIGSLLVVSGLIVNFIQLLAVIFILPFSRKAYRLFSAALLTTFWSEFVWLVEWWGCLELKVFCERASWDHFGKESALLICNHRSDVDWVVGWVLAQRSGVLGTTRALMKKVVQYLPIIGWSMWFSEYLFLARDWNKDKAVIKAGYERFRDFPLPFWVALFVEGTRFTEEKLKVAQEFATSAGLPVPKNTLVPRTKGFTLSVECMREFVPYIYDITIMVPDGVPMPTFTGLFQRQRSEIHVLVRRVPMTSLPDDSEGISKWCRDAFVLKDELLEEHKKHNSFDPKLLLPMKPSPWPVYYTSFWALVSVASVSWAIAHWMGSLTLSWSTLLWLLLSLAALFGLLQFLIFFTKSEYSTPLVSRPPRGAAESRPPGGSAGAAAGGAADAASTVSATLSNASGGGRDVNGDSRKAHDE